MTKKIFYTGSTIVPSKCIIHTPTISISFVLPENLENVKKKLQQQNYMCFFSKNSVFAFDKKLGKPSNSEIFSVGNATSALIEKTWGMQAREPKEKNAKGMVKLFSSLPQKPVIIPTGKKARKEFTNWLQQKKWDFIKLFLYQTVIVKNEFLHRQFQNTKNEYVIFTSPSTVEGFLKTFDIQNLQQLQAKCISIGPTTTKAIQKYQGTVYYESPQPNISFLIEKLKCR